MKNKFLWFITAFTLIFLLLIVFDISPYLRGPVDHFIPSRWPYYFVNTVNRLWAPVLVFILMIILFLKIDRQKKINKNKEILYLGILVLSVFFLQLSLVYFSRFNLTILFRRLADPGINGYFSTATKIKDTSQFLRNFPLVATNLDQHARDHPPGTVLFIKFFLNVFDYVSKQTGIFSSLHTLRVGDSKKLWDNLNSGQKAAGLFLPFFIHFLTSLIIVPFYLLIKKFSKGDIKTAFKTTLLYALIPSFAFFALLFDPIYAVFPIISLLLLGRNSQISFSSSLGRTPTKSRGGVPLSEKNGIKNFLISGIVFAIGLFFSLSILPILLGLVLFTLISYLASKNRKLITGSSFFCLGIILVFLILYLIGFNFIASFPAVIKNQLTREYLPWIVYNPYDFFLFLGIPTSILFLLKWLAHGTDVRKERDPDSAQNFSSLPLVRALAGMNFLTESGIKDLLNLIYKHFKLYQINNRLSLTFWVIFLTLIFSGVSRGEVGRIWQPLMFVPIMILSPFLSKISKNQFLLLISLLFLQLLVMEEFWVPVW